MIKRLEMFLGRDFHFLFVCTILGAGMAGSISEAAPLREEAVAKVQIVKGQLQRISKIGDTELLKEGSMVFSSDTVRTSQDGGCKIQLLKDGSVITLGPATQIIASDMKKNSENPSTLDVSYGRVRSLISKSNAGKIKLILKTRSATMGVRGTEFETSVNPQTGTTSNLTFDGEVAMAKTPKMDPPISESQARALNASEKFATPPPSFNPSQVAMVARAQVAMETQMKPERMTPEIRQAMAEIKKMSAMPAAGTTGVTLNEAQAKAIAVLEKESRTLPPSQAGAPAGNVESISQLKLAAQAAAPAANPPMVTPEAGKAFNEVLALTKENLGGAALPPAQTQAMQTLQALAKRAEASSTPIKPTPAELNAIAQIQRVAVQTTIVSSVAPTSEVFKTIGDPDKTVSVNRGQYSGMTATQEQPTIPVKISPSQMESMRNSSLLAPPVVTANNGQGAASAVPGKTISTVPPGLNAKAVSASLEETKAQMAKSGVKELPKSVDALRSSSAGVVPPPEGMLDSKTGRVAPPAGGFVDMKTGVYIPPPSGSAFDPVAGVYVPPPSMGTFRPETGTYVPPAGFDLDAAKGFVSTPKGLDGRTAPAQGSPTADKPFGDAGKIPQGGSPTAGPLSGAAGVPAGGTPGIGDMFIKGDLVITSGTAAPGAPVIPAGPNGFMPPSIPMGSGIPMGGVQNPFSTGPIMGPVLAFNPLGVPMGDKPPIIGSGPGPGPVLPPPPIGPNFTGVKDDRPIYPENPAVPPGYFGTTVLPPPDGATATAPPTTSVTISIQ